MKRPLQILLTLTLLVASGVPAEALPVSDGNAGSTERVNKNPIDAAISQSKANYTAGRADVVVLSRDDVFPDSLAGTALLGDGPMLLTASDRLLPAVDAEIDRVLADGGTVYLLGGPDALAPAVEQALAGRTVRRFAGDTRIDTAVQIADEVIARNGQPDEILIARSRQSAGDTIGASGWADSVAVGPYAAAGARPVLLTETGDLPAQTRTWLSRNPVSTIRIVGGPVAVSPQVEQQIRSLGKTVVRTDGETRLDTAERINSELLGIVDQQSERYFNIVNVYDAAGWAYGLPAAVAGDGTAVFAAHPDPNQQPAASLDLVTSCGSARVHLTALGSTAVISNAVLSRLDNLDPNGCDDPSVTHMCDAITNSQVANTAFPDDNFPVTNERLETAAESTCRWVENGELGETQVLRADRLRADQCFDDEPEFVHRRSSAGHYRIRGAKCYSITIQYGRDYTEAELEQQLADTLDIIMANQP